MFKIITQSLKRYLSATSLPSKSAILFMSLLLANPIIAAQQVERDLEDNTNRLIGITIQDNGQTAPIVAKGKEDAFSWQIAKHYESVVKIFETLADRELISIVDQLIITIGKEKKFFDRIYKFLISRQQERIYNWMIEDVLTRSNFIRESTTQQIISDPDNSDYSDEDGESLGRMYIRGYEGASEDDEHSEMSSASSSYEREENDQDREAGYVSCDEYYEDQAEDAYRYWQIRKLYLMLGIRVKAIEAFTMNTIDLAAIASFLSEHCNGGGGLRYSWLLNDDIEGSFSVSEDFASLVHKKMGVPEELIANIFGGLWFDYNWEQFMIYDPQFLQKTYIKTLTDLKDGKRATDVRERLLERIRDIFTFNTQDFNSPFNDIRNRYVDFNKRRNWLGALIEWSVYSTYRKVFANPSERSRINNYATTSPAIPLFQFFNREKYLLDRLNAAYIRAREEYTKVYPHHDTKKIVFGPLHPHRAELDLQVALGQLKGVGKALEPCRKRNTENVFVPQLYFIVSAQPNQASPSEGQQFFYVPLDFDGLPRRPLTRSNTDNLFTGVSEEDYFKQVKRDVVTGRVLQGTKKGDAEQEIAALINNNGLCNPNLIHSERGVVHAFRKPTNVTKICNDFANQLMTSCGAGAYTVHGAALLGYSTNTVCPCCTPTILSLQNSYETGGFLNLLVQNLNSLKGPVTFRTAGYNPETHQQDWTQFRLNTFITASIDFDKQSRDLAEQGQHSFGGNFNPPQKTHNSDGKLFFPNDEIDISEPILLEDGMPDLYQRFFYEFVGITTHTIPMQQNPYLDQQGAIKFPGVVFSSGSDSWGYGKLQ